MADDLRDQLADDDELTADTVCECMHDRGQHDGIGNCWHMNSAGDEDCDCDQFRHPAPPVTPDSDQYREGDPRDLGNALVQTVVRWATAEFIDLGTTNTRKLRSTLLSGPVGQLLRERDELRQAAWALNAELNEARAAVERVRRVRDALAQATSEAEAEGATPAISPRVVLAQMDRALDGGA